MACLLLSNVSCESTRLGGNKRGRMTKPISAGVTHPKPLCERGIALMRFCTQSILKPAVARPSNRLTAKAPITAPVKAKSLLIKLLSKFKTIRTIVTGYIATRSGDARFTIMSTPKFDIRPHKITVKVTMVL